MTTVLTFFKKSSLWIWLAIAIVAIVVAPLLLSGFRLGLLAKYICLAMVAVGVRAGLGPRRNADIGPGPLLRARRLHDGHASQARRCRPRRCTGLHVSLRQRRASRVVGAVPQPDCHADPHPGDTHHGRRFPARLGSLRPSCQGRLLRDPVTGTRSGLLTLAGQPGTSTGGFNGITDFKGFFGCRLKDPANKRLLYFIAAAVLIGMVLITRQIMRSRFGELLIAVRDQESRSVPRLQPGNDQDPDLHDRRRLRGHRWCPVRTGSIRASTRPRTSGSPPRSSSWPEL